MFTDIARSDEVVPRIPVGTWFEDLVDWLTTHLGPLFDLIDSVISALVDGIESGLLAVPTLVLIAVLAGIALLLRGWKFAVFSALGLLLIDGMDLWPDSMSTLALILVASFVAVVIAIPVGVLAARNEPTSRVVKPVLDFMQTMPAFVYLIPAVTFFSIGKVPGVIATVVFAMPPGVRLTELGIRQVDKEVVEAGHAFGATPSEILRNIQVPLATPTIMAGINQVIMLALSMVVIAGMVGAGGLGGKVFEAITRLNIGLGFEAGLAVVILAIYLDRMTGALGERSAVARAERLTSARG